MNRIQSFTVGAAAGFAVVTRVVLGRLELREADRERGDVPGWVLITLMTAGLVTILWTLAGNQLGALFTEAIGSVTGP